MAKERVINYHGGEKIYNKEMVDKLLDEKQDKLDIDKTIDKSSTNPVENQAIAKAISDLQEKHDEDIDTVEGKIGKLDTLKTVAKTDTVSAINELVADLDDKATKTELENLEDRHDKDIADLTKKIDDDIADLEEKHNKDIADLTKKHDEDMTKEKEERVDADNALDERVTDLEDKLLPMDEVPTEDSEKPVKSGGIFDAIRSASVKVGETMLWPQYEEEERVCHSDNPFKFDLNGVHYSKSVPDTTLKLKIANNVPDGWHALDGKAELDAADYPELVAWFGGKNITTDGKIWLPYCAKTIIKIAY